MPSMESSTVCKVIHGIDMIAVARVMMLGMFDAVDGGIAHEGVRDVMSIRARRCLRRDRLFSFDQKEQCFLDG